MPPICERCHLQKDNIEMRKCDYMLCDSCNDEFTENQYQVDGAMLDDESNSSDNENNQEEISKGQLIIRKTRSQPSFRVILKKKILEILCSAHKLQSRR